MRKLAKKSLPFEDFLTAAGASFEALVNEYGQGYAATKLYRFRYNQDEVQIAVRAKFDKWGNSVDFNCRPVPRTQEDFDALMVALSQILADKKKTREGTVDIWPYLRKCKREMRNEERLSPRMEVAA